MAATSIGNAQAIDLLTALRDSGIDAGATNPEAHLKIYDATGGVPARVDVAITTQVLCFDFLLEPPPSFETPVDNPGANRADMDVDTNWRSGTGSNPNTANKSAGTHTVAFFRIHDRNDAGIIQGDITTAATGTGDMLITAPDLSFNAGEQLRIDTHQIRMNEGP